MPPKAAAADRESVKVAVRLRPMSSTEVAAAYGHIVDIDKANATVYVTNPSGQKVNFRFDYAYPDNISQEEVYETIASPIVSGVLEGFNGTIFAYGQTGTGKTFSMDGKGNGELRGIVPRAFEHIFDYITANGESHQFMVTVTYVEIYNDELRDLLAQNNDIPLKIREDPQHGVQIRGVATHKVTCINDLMVLLNFGKKNRKVRKTNMNAESSRSHSILTLNVETLTQIEGGQHVRSARLNLVDLAGSERVAKTGAEGMGFKEGVNINYELMILGNCISALTSKGITHIPYRDSKLTMLLRDSLGGNARTMMIAALGPADYNFSETMSTLRYAERAKKIENKPKVNMDPKDALLLKYQEELAALQAQIAAANGGVAIDANDKEAINKMEQQLADQRKQLANATNVASKEKEEMQKKLAEQEAKLEAEKNRRNQYEQRLQELNKFLVNGGHDLKKKTEQNEQQIAAIRKKLKEREERASALQREIRERQEKQQEVVSLMNTIHSKVEAVTAQFDELISSYKNLKIKLPEVQKTIQEDRANMAQNIESLNSQIELYSLIIENFVPVSEVENARNNTAWDEDRNRWVKKDVNKKSLVQQVVSLERPKSATGHLHPTAMIRPASVNTQLDLSTIQLSVKPVKAPLKQGPMLLKVRQVEETIETAFRDQESDMVVDIPNNRSSASAYPALSISRKPVMY